MTDLSINREDLLNGSVFLFDKPYKWTSFQLVNKVRYMLCKKFGIKKLKVGHAGTLDPLATGLIILCTGKATKTIESIMGIDKEYIAEFTLGQTTPSFDAETEVDGTFPTEHINKEMVVNTLADFKGSIMQEPPLFSAKNINGVRAYHLARSGSDQKLPAVEVTIHELEILDFELPKLVLKINCSKGTYIRSLARDVGKALNSGAYMTGLKRTGIGDYQVKDAWDFEKFE
ncbi:MAG: tRNA pseudouridine(55) synthase TruB, partial [Bacteroidales bacterium]|nr:tRNA pseudouridine(55) synthase TruB [Bacteroidales bacterium]